MVVLLLTKENGIKPKVKSCGICYKTGHPTYMCPLLQEDIDRGNLTNIATTKLGENFQQRNQYQTPPGFQHPFQKNQHQNNFQQPHVHPQASSSNMSLEYIVKSFATSNQAFQNETESSLKNLEQQVSQLANSMSKLEAQTQGKFSSQTEKNPKNNACVVTLRSDEEEEIVAEQESEATKEVQKKDKHAEAELADCSLVHPKGVLEDVLVQVNELIFPADIYVLDIGYYDSPNSSSILLGRPFLKTARTKIDVYDGILSMKFDGEVINFNIYDAMRYPDDVSTLNFIDVIEPLTVVNVWGPILEVKGCFYNVAKTRVSSMQILIHHDP
uniref:Uncharacterized protein n=1 Tax=Lactuca sativa TaxID=4236 RepID=A0A9R1WVB9_LACSA|nr:hypothetical protein LSAT_V11C900459020 [Lactuca sativa]